MRIERPAGRLVSAADAPKGLISAGFWRRREGRLL
jgi:hypothetical protein